MDLIVENKKRKIVHEEFDLCTFDSYFAIFVYFLLCLFGFSWRGEKSCYQMRKLKFCIYMEENIYCQLCACQLLAGNQGGYLMDVSVCLISALLIEDFEPRISVFKLIKSSTCSRTGITSLPIIQKSYTELLFAWHSPVMLHTSSQQGAIFFWASWRGDTLLLLLLCSHPKILVSELFRHLERREGIKNMY